MPICRGANSTTSRRGVSTCVGADLRDARFNRLDPREIDLTGVRMDAEQGLEVLRTLGIQID